MIIHRNDFQIDLDNPHRRFKKIFGGGAKKVKAPPPIAPPPTPAEIDEEVRLKDQARRRQKIAQAGRGGTILTEGRSLASGSATLLGRSTA